MPKVTVYDMAGRQVGEKDLPKAVFAVEPNQAVLHSVVRQYLNNQRQGTQSTRTRSEVSGGGRKPWRQKGSGHARQGSTRAPQWTHGGVALGPKPRSYRTFLNKKVKTAALKSALSEKVLGSDLVLVDAIRLDGYRTKTVVDMLKALGAAGKALIVTDTADPVLVQSARNIPGCKASNVGELNTYDLLNAGKAILTVAAADRLEEVYAK